MFKVKKHVPGEKTVTFQNYRGIKVLGTSVYITQLQWDLLAEIDQKEALAPLGKTRVLIIAILIFIPVGGNGQLDFLPQESSLVQFINYIKEPR